MSEFLIKSKVAAYLLLNEEIKDAKAQQAKLKEELDPYLESAQTNARGSRVLVFSDALQVGDTKYSGLQRVRKESKVLNEERVTEWLSAKQNSGSEEDIFWDDLISNSDIFITVRHINQDTLWDWFVQDLITQEELNSFFDVTESYAFMPTKE